MSGDAILSIRDVSKTFGQRHALDGVSLRVGAGEMVALIGPSGSGKSTLLRAISGLVAIDAGEGTVEAFGTAVQARGRVSRQVRAARSRIGFIFQQFNLVPRLSLFTNAALGALGRIGFWRGLVGAWPAEARATTMAALQRMGVAEQAGQRAEVILADEPVASLDPVSARRVMEALRDLNARDRLTVVVSLHQVDYARRYCERVVALSAGKVAFDGPAAELTPARLSDIYGPEYEDALWEGADA